MSNPSDFSNSMRGLVLDNRVPLRIIYFVQRCLDMFTCIVYHLFITQTGAVCSARRTALCSLRRRLRLFVSARQQTASSLRPLARRCNQAGGVEPRRHHLLLSEQAMRRATTIYRLCSVSVNSRPSGLLMLELLMVDASMFLTHCVIRTALTSAFHAILCGPSGIEIPKLNLSAPQMIFVDIGVQRNPMIKFSLSFNVPASNESTLLSAKLPRISSKHEHRKQRDVEANLRPLGARNERHSRLHFGTRPTNTVPVHRDVPKRCGVPVHAM